MAKLVRATGGRGFAQIQLLHKKSEGWTKNLGRLSRWQFLQPETFLNFSRR
jgi:hypothetical protein